MENCELYLTQSFLINEGVKKTHLSYLLNGCDFSRIDRMCSDEAAASVETGIDNNKETYAWVQ